MLMKRCGNVMRLLLVSGMVLSLSACGSQVAETGQEPAGEVVSASGPEAVSEAATEPVTEPVVLDVWHQWQGQNTKLETFTNDAIAAYEVEHPDIRIQVHSLTGEVYKTNIPMAFSGEADDIDVFYYHVPGYMKRLVDTDKLLPLNEYLSEEVLGKLREGTLAETSVGDQIYGLPLYSSKYLIYCNRALFEQAGAKLPETFEELLSAGEKLKQIGVTPLAVGAQEPWLASSLYEAAVLPQVGADMVKSVLSGEVSICDAPEFRRAAEQVNQLYEEGILGDTPTDLSEHDSMAAFFNGQAAMLMDGTWASRYIDGSGMKLDDVSVIEFPAPAGSPYAGAYVGGITAGSFFVNKYTDTPQEAADFAIYLTEYLGSRVYESGSGMACWEADTSQISPTLKKVVDIWEVSAQHIPAWDNLLPQKAAEIHLSQCQGLMMENADIDGFLAVQDAAFAVQEK